jgi:hypothetical protein
VEVESALLRSGVSLEQMQTASEGDLIRYEVRASFPPSGILEDLERRTGRIAGQLRMRVDASGGEVAILWDEAPWFLLRFHPPALPVAKKGPRVAIIMDDLGGDVPFARSLLEIDLQVTFSIMPGNPHAAQIAEMAHRGGREVMIHIPMEPQGYPATNPGRDALLVGYPAEEIRRRFRQYVEKVPFAVGGNNHMGSRFTEDRQKMGVVLEEMKGAGLFFVDSLTSPDSVAFTEARKAGVPAAIRDRFLDNDREVAKISREIRQLAKMAENRGSAVGICHPYPQTLEALRQETAFLRRQGIEVVPASRLLIR